ncbi:MAG: alanine racemase [Chloroflexota bacterium]|nr:alanine racemase [Chloroflexota bacterium]
MTDVETRLAPIPVPRLPAPVDTPAVVVDRARLEGNIARLQAELDRRGVALRPHAKTHKSVRVAQLQLEGGARGIAVGTLGEAEVFAAAGIRDLFVAYPVWADGPKAGRLRELHDAADLRVGVDSAAGAARLAAAVAGSRKRLTVLVEIDSGLHRTGVADPAEAAVVAEAARRGGLVVAGVFTHGGHSYRPGRRAEVGAQEVASLEAAAAALESAGFEVETISAGSTPTMLEAAKGRVNEIRAGTYVLGDRQQWALGTIPPEGVAVFVAATVVSEAPGQVVLDAGAKSLTKDRAEWLDGFGLMPAYPAGVIAWLNDYHGVVRFPAGAPRPALGEVVAIAPNHVCPVIDLFDVFWVVAEDGSAERWPVDARGRSG